MSNVNIYSIDISSKATNGKQSSQTNMTINDIDKIMTVESVTNKNHIYIFMHTHINGEWSKLKQSNYTKKQNHSDIN